MAKIAKIFRKKNHSSPRPDTSLKISKQGFASRFNFIKRNFTRKKKIFLFIFLIFLTATLSGFYFYKKFYPFSENKGGIFGFLPSVKKEEKEICPLTGQLVEKEKAKRWPAAIVIENHFAARPQSGLEKADLVFEALAEGGITRFLAFFHCQDVEEIGPVRSARPYFLKWASEYKALFAYVGGSPKALRLIPTFLVYDLNQFFNSQYFWRTKTRPAPHNVYTSTEKLLKAGKQKFHFKEFIFSGYQFKDESLWEERKEIQEIKINYRSSIFVVIWKYSKEKNTYLRFQGGKSFIDKTTNNQIEAKNIVLMWVSTFKEDNYGRLAMVLEGKGKAQVFQEGKSIEATWKKQSPSSQTLFFDKEGKEIQFTKGNIWIQVLPLGISVTTKN